MHDYYEYGWLRGFNIVPSWGARIEQAGYGWIGWGMREGKAVSTRRDRYDANGIDNEGFHAWFTAAGDLRGGLEFLTAPPRRRAPWEDV